MRVRSLSKNGTIAVFSHAGPSFSFAYGLCSNLFENSLRAFVETFVMGSGESDSGLAPAGVIRAAFNDAGECVSLHGPDNSAWINLAKCGKTTPHKNPTMSIPGNISDRHSMIGRGCMLTEAVIDFYF